MGTNFRIRTIAALKQTETTGWNVLHNLCTVAKGKMVLLNQKPTPKNSVPSPSLSRHDKIRMSLGWTAYSSPVTSFLKIYSQHTGFCPIYWAKSSVLAGATHSPPDDDLGLIELNKKIKRVELRKTSIRPMPYTASKKGTRWGTFRPPPCAPPGATSTYQENRIDCLIPSV